MSLIKKHFFWSIQTENWFFFEKRPRMAYQLRYPALPNGSFLFNPKKSIEIEIFEFLFLTHFALQFFLKFCLISILDHFRLFEHLAFWNLLKKILKLFFKFQKINFRSLHKIIKIRILEFVFPFQPLFWHPRVTCHDILVIRENVPESFCAPGDRNRYKPD